MPEIFSATLDALRDDLVHRRISVGIARLEQLRPCLEKMVPQCPEQIRILGHLAQWVDLGFDGDQLLRDLLTRLPESARRAAPFPAYVQLRFAEGFIAVRDEEPDRAIPHFRFILSIGDDLPERALPAFANHWVARCFRKKGQYDEALQHALDGKAAARAEGLESTAAIIGMLEAWILFQKGRVGEALRLLKESEAVLCRTDDYIALGNLHSAYGRIARREGKYDQALQHFATAIDNYKQRDTQHPNLARSLANMAFVQRLIALQISRRLDADRARRQRASENLGAPQVLRPQKERLEHLKADALRNLAESLRIHESHHQYRGAGNVHSIRGSLYYDHGELDLAEADASAAYQLGHEKQDRILMARGRVLHCMVENAKFEEGIEEKGDPVLHAQLAYQYAVEAVDCARQTQNRRLLARAFTWEGLTFCNDYFHNPEDARHCCDQAAALVKPDGEHDYVWEDLQLLNNKLMGAGSIDSVLREWSQGLVGDKTFQQITEEFAGIIIPKVWEREGRKISRVAQRLSISPKKVRRILAKRRAAH